MSSIELNVRTLTGAKIAGTGKNLNEAIGNASKQCGETGDMALIRLPLTRDQAEQLFASYSTRNRPTSDDEISEMVERILAGKWVERWPNIVYDENGRMINGGHSLAAIIKADKFPFVAYIILGVSRGMGVLMDVLKKRGVSDQLSYIPGMLDGMGNDLGKRQNFATAAGYIYSILYSKRDRPSDKMRKKIATDDGNGHALLRRIKPVFLEIDGAIDDDTRDDVCKAAFYVPAIMIAMMGKQNESLAKRFINGEQLPKEVSKARDSMLALTNRSATVSREATEVYYVIYKALSALLSHTLNIEFGHVPKVEMVKEDGIIKRKEWSGNDKARYKAVVEGVTKALRAALGPKA